jgi:hypothetical protein
MEKKGMNELKKIIVFLAVFYLFTHAFSNNERFFHSIDQKTSKPVKQMQDKIVDRVKTDLNNTYQDTKISLFTEVTKIEETKDLVNEGYSYSDIIKLKIMSQITKNSIHELIEIDGVVNYDQTGSKQVNMAQLLEMYDITEEELMDKLEDYKELTLDSIYQIIDLN